MKNTPETGQERAKQPVYLGLTLKSGCSGRKRLFKFITKKKEVFKEKDKPEASPGLITLNI